MPAQSIIERSFSGGELSPALYARTDHVKYSTGLKTLRNMICMRHGGVTQRPGTMFVADSLNSGNPVRLLPFIFNETGLGQSYVLEFGNLYISFYQNGGAVLLAGVPYTIVSPYAQADLFNLKFAESADVITITHPSYPIYELKRLGPTNWTITAPTFGSPIGAPPTINITGTVGANVPWYNYAVTSVNAKGEESDAIIQTELLGQFIANASPTTPETIQWGAVADAISYRVYRSNWNASFGAGNRGQLGFVGQTVSLTFIDTGVTPDYTQIPPLNPGLFTSPGNYPSTVGFVQQRRAFAATTNNPLGFWLSQPGDFYNFDTHLTSLDSDGILSSLAGEEVNSIQYLLELKFMLMLTAGAEIYVQGDGTGVVKPSAINASTQSQYGCSALRPLKIGDVLLFNQALGSFIRDFSFDFSIDGYRGNDLTVFSSHLFEGRRLVDWSFQKIPDSIIWAARDDGVVLSCTYVREQQILAWARHDFAGGRSDSGGTVESICAIPENGEYAVYLSIYRFINGASHRYIERLSSRVWSDPLTVAYLDSYSSYDGRNTTAITMTLDTLFPGGPFDTTSSAYGQSLALTSSAPYFNSGMVGDQIFLQDAEFISSQGVYGHQIRCTIVSFISNTQVGVRASAVVPAEFQRIAVLTWSRAVNTVSGLDYLEGQEVSVWADRFVVGSPLNQQVTTTYTVTGGSITLDKPYAVIYVGIPMIADFETLDIDTGFGESILDQPKAISRVVMYLQNTRGFFGGTENPDTDPNNIVDGVVQDRLFNLIELKAQENRLTYDAPPSLITDPAFSNISCNWSKNGRVFVRNVDPIPLTILAVIPAGLTAAKVPYSQKV